MAGFASRLITIEARDLTRVLVKPLLYDSDLLGCRITVPAGFETDGASVPRAAPIAFALFGGTANAPAAIHDWLYSTQPCTREQADDVFREACLSIGIAPWRVAAMHWALRRFGGAAWAAHAKAKG